jgi:integrase
MSRVTVDAYAFLFHGLRHTCASIIGTTGVAPRYAQDRLGHAGVSLTMNITPTSFPKRGPRLLRK